MKNMIKILAALLVVATVGLASMGCDETTTSTVDIGVTDMAKKG